MTKFSRIQDTTRLLDLKLRRLILRIYNLATPLVSWTRIQKLRFKGKTLGCIIYCAFLRVLHFRLPEPLEVHGMIMHHHVPQERGWFGWSYAFDYEPLTCRAFKQIVKPGMTVVDVGANIGYYTLLAAKLLRGEGKIYAFEPDPSYYLLLAKNIAANNLYPVAESSRVAVADTQKRASLILGRSSGTSLFRTPDSTQEVVDIDVISLDSFFAAKNYPPVHFVKIDTEGADKLVLEGMRELARRNSRMKIIVELAPRYLKDAGTSAGDLLDVLIELGFNRVRPLYKREGFYKIPQDIEYIVELGEKLSCVNLLCERQEV